MAVNMEKMSNDKYRKMLIEKFSRLYTDNFSQKEAIDLLVLTVCPKKDYESISEQLIERFGCNIANIINADVEKIGEIKGLNVQAAEFIHSIPKIARIYAHGSRDKNQKITKSNIGYYMISLMLHRKEEVFYAVSLNKDGCVIAENLINRGAVSSVVVNLKELSKAILFSDAYAVILAHNHPGGSVKPSKEDIEVTKFLADYIRNLDIILIDHIIVNDNDYYSMCRHYPKIFYGK